MVQSTINPNKKYKYIVFYGTSPRTRDILVCGKCGGISKMWRHAYSPWQKNRRYRVDHIMDCKIFA